MRLIEGIIYNSPLYCTASQTVSLSPSEAGRRRFVLTTPRLKTDGQLHLDLPFADERIDHLSRMRSVAQPGDFAKEMLAIRSDQEDLLWRCFTESGPQPYAENHHQGVRLKLFASGCM